MRVFAFLALLALSSTQAQTVEDLTAENATNGSHVNVEWTGQTGKYYYLQCSSDLENWAYTGTVDAGDGSQISYGFPTTILALNFRVVERLTAPTDDADGDGLTEKTKSFSIKHIPMKLIRTETEPMTATRLQLGPILGR